MSDQLFEWEVPTKRTRTTEGPAMVPREPGWHLITNTNGVQGFHLTSIPDAMYATNGSIRTLCGIDGRRMGIYPDRIVECTGCINERERQAAAVKGKPKPKKSGRRKR